VPERWLGHLQLEFAQRQGETVLARRKHVGPYLVQKPFYAEDGACHVYLLHPPGGIVGGDALQLDVDTAPGCRVLLTAPAATKFYRSAGPPARNSATLRVGRGACVEWLPHETIVYRGAIARSEVQVQLGAGAHFCGWDLLCLGRPASAEIFEQGQVRSFMAIDDDSGPLWRERFALDAEHELRTSAWGLQGQAVSATLVATLAPAGQPDDGVPCEVIERARALPAPERGHLTISRLGLLLVARYLGPSTLDARRAFEQLWTLWRSEVVGTPAILPRIWST
jgi:urease accessory protein